MLDWADASGVRVIEDDYLSELQLAGRAAPALASLDRAGRFIHIGSFSKTISPTLHLGFIVAPIGLLARFAEVAACLAPPPGPSVQLATAEFMREGHYLRHLRRLKRAYAAKRDDLLAQLRRHFDADNVMATGLAVLLRLPDGTPDLTIAREILAFGMFPNSALGLVWLRGDQPVWTLVGRCDIADKRTREILRPLGRYYPAFQLNC